MGLLHVIIAQQGHCHVLQRTGIYIYSCRIYGLETMVNMQTRNTGFEVNNYNLVGYQILFYFLGGHSLIGCRDLVLSL